MTTLVSTQKWFFTGPGFTSMFLVAALVNLWRRRMSRKRLAEDTFWLPTISTWTLLARLVYLIMADLVKRPLLLLRTREYDDDGVFGDESTETLVVRSDRGVVVPSATVGLGDFIQSFWRMVNLLLCCHWSIGMYPIVRVLWGCHGVDVMSWYIYTSFDNQVFSGVYREDIWNHLLPGSILKRCYFLIATLSGLNIIINLERCIQY